MGDSMAAFPNQALRSGFAALLLLAAACATAPTPKVEKAADPPEAGLPMWVIRDADSTIYLTGTVHVLPPDVVWMHPKLQAAIRDADELWLEIAMKGDLTAMQAEILPKVLPYMLASKPLSSLLTDDEKSKLADAIARAKLPAGSEKALDMMKPWVVTQMIGIGPLMAGGYQAEAGIDINLVKKAEEDGDRVKGLETIEDQMRIFAGGTEEEQLAALRVRINVPPEKTAEMLKTSDDAFTAWARGDVAALETLFAGITQESMGGPSLEKLIYQRNETWANQIEKLLKEGSGVTLIAVGGGHLVGTRNVRELLQKRGIEVVRY